MKKIGNILWHFPFCGFISSFGNFVLGSILVITVVGAPIGLGLIQFSKFLLAPFSNVMVSKKKLDIKQNPLWKKYGLLIQILYFPFGFLMAISSLMSVVGLAVTVVGIPLAIVIAKSLSTYINPVNKICVPEAVASELETQKARQRLNRYAEKP